METISSLVDALINNLMALMPFVIVKSYQRGVRWKLGKNPEELQPGFHWKLYLYHEIEKVTVVDDAIHLPSQTVLTKDGRTVHFKTSFGFRIVDAVKHYCSVKEFKEATIAIAMRHLAKRVRALEYNDLVNDLTKLENSLENTLTTQFKSWGTEVFAVGFSDFAEITTGLRVYGDDEIFKHLEG